jgi:hypothetical protein
MALVAGRGTGDEEGSQLSMWKRLVGAIKDYLVALAATAGNPVAGSICGLRLTLERALPVAEGLLEHRIWPREAVLPQVIRGGAVVRLDDRRRLDRRPHPPPGRALEVVGRADDGSIVIHFAMTRVLDACYRGAYCLAYPLAMLWWWLRGNTGITVAVWVGERVLLVRHSYKWGLRLPGGSVRSGEDHCSAAARELQEEVGLTVPLNDLRLVGPFRTNYGTNYLYEIELLIEPKLAVDRREIVSARFAPA